MKSYAIKLYLCILSLTGKPNWIWALIGLGYPPLAIVQDYSNYTGVVWLLVLVPTKQQQTRLNLSESSADQSNSLHLFGWNKNIYSTFCGIPAIVEKVEPGP